MTSDTSNTSGKRERDQSDARARKLRRPNLQHAFERDLQRHASRQSAVRSFWRSLSVLGAVGWPIVLLTAGGALLGHWLDGQWQTGVRLTLMLVMIGALLGGLAAWSIIQGTRR